MEDMGKEIDPAEEAKRREREELKRLLESHGISTAHWGEGASRTLDNLAQEITEGETKIVEDADGKLMREVRIAKVDVVYRDESGEYRLVEDHQEFADGRSRSRPGLRSSVAEKIKGAEDPAAAARRGLLEELGFEGEISIEPAGTNEETENSMSYPGLMTKYTEHLFTVVLTQERFKPEGYIEDTPTLKTFFKWVKREKPRSSDPEQ